MDEMFLPIGTVLQGKYRIERHIASGGFGNTYVATHLNLDAKVAVKEFFMKGVNHREDDSTTVSVSNPASRPVFDEQKRKFQKEARRLSVLNNPHIVKVSDLFEENNTSYYVMDFIEGESLSAIQKHQGYPFYEKQSLNILSQMLDALESIHVHSIWHMDIKPGNILMDSAGHCTLIDFGSSKQTASSEGTTTSTALSYTPGYAPQEQINGFKDSWGPWTDFYALGATMYNLLTGSRPPQSNEILDSPEDAFTFPETVSDKSRQLVIWMMALSTKKRPQSVDEIRNFLPVDAIFDSTEVNEPDNEDTVSEHTVSAPVSSSASTVYGDVRKEAEAYESTVIDEYPKVAAAPPSPRPKKSKTVYWLSGIVLALGIVAAILGIKTCGNKDGEAVAEGGDETEAVERFDSSPYSNGEKKSFTVNGVSFNMVKVDGGTFTMGATEEQGGDADDDEKPAHSVTLDGYMIGETEVTQALWQAVMGDNWSAFKGDDQRPVEMVRWDDCQEFIKKLNTATGQCFRLPTEAEWEFAARGGVNSRGYKYSGSNTLGNVAWYGDNSSSTTHPVATKTANELGIYDMSGNVDEWCNDWYGDYSSSSQTNPQGPSSGSDRVSRGGSWLDNAGFFCRVSGRNYFTPDDSNLSLGLRLGL